MSKLIIEMEMPKSCPCDLVGIGYDMCCSAASGIPKRVAEYDECVKNGTRPDWCPILGILPEDGFSGGVSDEITKAWERYHESEKITEKIAVEEDFIRRRREIEELKRELEELNRMVNDETTDD